MCSNTFSCFFVILHFSIFFDPEPNVHQYFGDVSPFVRTQKFSEFFWFRIEKISKNEKLSRIHENMTEGTYFNCVIKGGGL